MVRHRSAGRSDTGRIETDVGPLEDAQRQREQRIDELSVLPLEVGQEIEYFVTLPTIQTPGTVVRLHCLGHVVRRDSEQGTLTASIERYEFVSHPQTASAHAA